MLRKEVFDTDLPLFLSCIIIGFCFFCLSERWRLVGSRNWTLESGLFHSLSFVFILDHGLV